MNISLNMSGGEIESATLTELRLLVAAIQAGWQTEHQIDGTHTPVTSVRPTQAMFSGPDDPADMIWNGAQGATAGVQRILYRLQSDLLWVQVHVDGLTIANTPAYLRVLIPGGFESQPGDNVVAMGWAFDNATNGLMTVQVWQHHLACFLVPDSVWQNATMNTSIAFTVEFRVKNRRGQ